MCVGEWVRRLGFAAALQQWPATVPLSSAHKNTVPHRLGTNRVDDPLPQTCISARTRKHPPAHSLSLANPPPPSLSPPLCPVDL